MHLCDVWACRSNLCELESTSWTLLRVIFVKAQVSRTHLFTIHLTLENSKGEVCDEGEAIYFTFGPDKAREMGFDSCKVEGEE